MGVLVREIINFSSYWRWTSFSSTVEPTIYLLAFGFGFGALVSQVDGLDYIEFVGTGTVATAVMFSSVFATMFGTFFKREFQHTYDAILAAPVDAEELVTGEVLWVAMRAAVYGSFPLLVAMVLRPRPDVGHARRAVHRVHHRLRLGGVRRARLGGAEVDRPLLLRHEHRRHAGRSSSPAPTSRSTACPSGRRCSASSTRSTTASSWCAAPRSAGRAWVDLDHVGALLLFGLLAGAPRSGGPRSG